MYGFQISIYHLASGGASPATSSSELGVKIIEWQTGLFGTDWIEELVKEGKGIKLLQGDYPSLYTAKAEILMPKILSGIPCEREIWVPESWALTKNPNVRTMINKDEMAICRPDEWLMVEAWDLS